MFVNTLSVFLVVSYSPSHGKTVPEEGSIIRVRDASEYNKIYHVQLLVDNQENCKKYSLDKATLIEAVWLSDSVYYPCSFTITSDEPFCVEIFAENIPCESSIPLLWLRQNIGKDESIKTLQFYPSFRLSQCYQSNTVAIATFQSNSPKRANSSFKAKFYTTTDMVPVNNTWVVFNAHSYYFGHQRVTWFDARDFCESIGSHLVKIDSKEEGDWLSRQQVKEENLWIGGIRSFYGDFVWYNDMEDMPYTNWYPGEPNMESTKTCALMSAEHKGSWADALCTAREGFVCEIKFS